VAQGRGATRDRRIDRPARRPARGDAEGGDPPRPADRWGSAARTGRLSFSWRLILAPPEALDTVVVHELAHLRVLRPRTAVLGARYVAPRRPPRLAPLAP
jgi:hypothetical protein